MPYDMNEEYETSDREQAERALRILNHWAEEPKWTITEFERCLTPHYCFTRADGSTDDRATREDLRRSVDAILA